MVCFGGGGRNEISFTILGGMNQNFGMEFFFNICCSLLMTCMGLQKKINVSGLAHFLDTNVLPGKLLFSSTNLEMNTKPIIYAVITSRFRFHIT
jgi:hypothetical protein